MDSFFWYQLSSPKGALFIKLNNGEKFEAFVSAYSKDSKSSLYDFLKKGDSVYKPQNKDSIYILRNKLRYSFFLPTREYHDSIFKKKN